MFFPWSILFIIKGGFYTAGECASLVNKVYFQGAFMFILLTAAVWLKNEFHRWSLFIWGRKIGSFPDAEMLLLTIAISTWGYLILKIHLKYSDLAIQFLT